MAAPDGGWIGKHRDVDRAADHVREDLNEQRIVPRQPAGERDPLDRESSGEELVENRTGAEAKAFEQSAVDVSGGRREIEASDQAAEVLVCEGDAISVPPVERDQAGLSRAKRRGVPVVETKVLGRTVRARESPDESGEHVAEAGLTRFVAPNGFQRWGRQARANGGSRAPRRRRCLRATL